MRVAREFTFEAAHELPGYPGDCARLHGHSYRLRVEVAGPVAKNGMVIDFRELEGLVRKNVLDGVDHRFLNDAVCSMPTAENMAQIFYNRLSVAMPKGVRLTSLRLYETSDSYAEAS